MQLNSPTVYLVEDDSSVRRALRAALEITGHKVEAYESAESFLENYDPAIPGCLVLDLRLGGMSGLQLLESLQPAGRALPVIMISGQGQVADAVKSLKLGAIDFLEKPLDLNVLIASIRSAIDPKSSTAHRSQNAADARLRLKSLTPREIEILKMLAMGKSSKQIAAEANLSTKTVSNHRAHLLAKTNSENTASLVRLALLAGVANDAELGK